MVGGCPEDGWRVPGGWLEGARRMVGGCPEDGWRVPGGWLEGARRMVGGCPKATIVVMGAEVRCLLAREAQVSTLTESYYRKHLEPNVELVDISIL